MKTRTPPATFTHQEEELSYSLTFTHQAEELYNCLNVQEELIIVLHANPSST